MSYPSDADIAASMPHFDDAVKYINGLPKESPVPGVELTAAEERLGHYALYKVASVGKGPSPSPPPPSLVHSTPRIPLLPLCQSTHYRPHC